MNTVQEFAWHPDRIHNNYDQFLQKFNTHFDFKALRNL